MSGKDSRTAAVTPDDNACSECGLPVLPGEGAPRWQHIPALHTACMARRERMRRPADKVFTCPFCSTGQQVLCYKDPAFLIHTAPLCQTFIDMDPTEFLVEARRAQTGRLDA